MSDQQAAILRAADGAQIAQAKLNDVVFEPAAVALCDEIEHHLSTWTISHKATRDVNLAIDAFPKESQAASRQMVCEAVAEPDTVLLMMRPKALCQLVQFGFGRLHNCDSAARSEQVQQGVQSLLRIVKVVQRMDNMDDVKTIARRERFDVLLPEREPDIGKLQFVKTILKTTASDWVRIDSRVFDTF